MWKKIENTTLFKHAYLYLNGIKTFRGFDPGCPCWYTARVGVIEIICSSNVNYRSSFLHIARDMQTRSTVSMCSEYFHIMKLINIWCRSIWQSATIWLVGCKNILSKPKKSNYLEWFSLLCFYFTSNRFSLCGAAMEDNRLNELNLDYVLYSFLNSTRDN